MTPPWTRLAPDRDARERWLHHCRFDGAGTSILSRAHLHDLQGCAWCAEYPPDFFAQLTLMEALRG